MAVATTTHNQPTVGKNVSNHWPYTGHRANSHSNGDKHSTMPTAPAAECIGDRRSTTVATSGNSIIE